MNSKKHNIAFYQNLAKLFYAISASDKMVREEEFSALKEIVLKEWVAVDDYKDMFDTDAAYQIVIVFDWLNHKHLNAVECYEEFIVYKNEHAYFFTNNINALILSTANAIAYSFSTKNKSELIMLAKLNIELNKT